VGDFVNASARLIVARIAYRHAWERFMRARGIKTIVASYRVGVAYRRLVEAKNLSR